MKPLIFFVHVPKTAGSTINSYLQSNLPNGRGHIEGIIDTPGFVDLASSADWLSGHVDLMQAKTRFASVTNRPIRFFTCVRNPVDQLLSHYNWLFEIYHRGEEFYQSHPDYIRDLSERMRNNSGTPQQIIEILQDHAGFFLECQSNYVLGPCRSGHLSQYEMIGFEGSIDKLLSRMVGKRTRVNRTENRSRYHLDRTLFSSPEMLAFLRHSGAQDSYLYRRIASGLDFCEALEGEE